MLEADSNDELKNACMRNHSYATFAYLKIKLFLYLNFLKLHIRGFVTFFSSPFTICSYEVL